MTFRQMFPGVSLDAEDLYLLEAFQIEYLPGWIPEREFAAVLWAYRSIKRYLVMRCPSVGAFIERIMGEHSPAIDARELAVCVDHVVWTIADLLVYNKCPEAYDRLPFHAWDFSEVTEIVDLAGKVIVDGGAGTGRVALEAARMAKHVYAVEPVARLRRFIREKAAEARLSNLYVTDGFLHALPLPDGYADIVITSHALGWHLERELSEVERVVSEGGTIIHCPGTAVTPGEEAQHRRLVSSEWGYAFAQYEAPDGWKRKYWKGCPPAAGR